jgi:hypothetical protein
MAQFISKTDYFGLAGSSLAVTSDTSGYAVETIEPTDDKGSYVADAAMTYGAKLSPSNDYALKAKWTPETFALGSVRTVRLAMPASSGIEATEKDWSICLTNVTISTSAGSAPTVSASGESVEDGSVATCTYNAAGFSLPTTHHAHILMDAFSLTGDGCYLKSANYTMSCSMQSATKDGTVLSHDVTEGVVECQIEILQTRDANPDVTTPPVVTPGDGWVVVSPPTRTNSDSDYPTWSCTLRKYLAKTTA